MIVSIVNPSFEPVGPLPGYPSDPNGLRGFAVPGWDFGPGSGVFQPSNPNPSSIALPPSKTVALAGYESFFSQTLAVSPADIQKSAIAGRYTEGSYALKFLVANYFPGYPGYYEAKISFGTQELGDVSGWATHKFTEVTASFPSPDYLIAAKSLPGGGHVQGQEKFKITFTVDEWTVLFDNVSLTFTPN